MRAQLFGHKKGAFTGADAAREGAFRTAHQGTLFLDELGELPLDLQSSLLRALETREVQPLGEDRTIPVDVRVVAMHRDLASMVSEGRFRQDLYQRLRIIQLSVPPLRERRPDLRGLVLFPFHQVLRTPWSLARHEHWWIDGAGAWTWGDPTTWSDPFPTLVKMARGAAADSVITVATESVRASSQLSFPLVFEMPVSDRRPGIEGFVLLRIAIPSGPGHGASPR